MSAPFSSAKAIATGGVWRAWFSGPAGSGWRVLAGFLLIAAVGCAPPPPAPTLPAQSNILLITVDTLRADHLSAYGYPRDTSPTLARLASEGIRFDRPAVQWPKTGPSFASLFTATYSKDNGITRQVGIPLPGKFLMLAEELRAQGYQTHAVVSNGAVASALKYDQGFDSYIETWKFDDAEMPRHPNRAERVTRFATETAATIDPDRPYFLWVHYLDPHAPYNAPGEAKDRFVGDDWYDETVKVPVDFDKRRLQMGGIGYSQMLEKKKDLAFYEARYDGEIAYADRYIGELLESLGGKGLMDNTLTVVTADHGESLGEHKYYFDHGRFSFETCLRVPLIAHFPGVIKPRVDPDPVQLIDLAPTFLEAAGVTLEEGRWAQGKSLGARMLDPSRTQEAYAFSEAGYASDNAWQKVAQDRRFKLVYAQVPREQRWIGGNGVEFTLFDLDSDPEETQNVADAFPDDLRRLQRLLADWNQAPPFGVELDPSSDDAEGELDDETRDQLEALGYLQ